MPENDETAETHPPTPSTGGVDDAVMRLVELTGTLKPFLDTYGIAHCRLPDASRITYATFPLSDSKVKDVLLFMYYNAYQNQPLPSESQMSRALALVRGQLWCTREGVAGKQRPLVQLIIKAAEQADSWVGSASELTTLLTKLERDTPTLGVSDKLLTSEDALGVALSKCSLELREANIELYRPLRRDKKRLWAWRRLHIADDTSDTMDNGEASIESAPTSQNSVSIHDHDTSDTSHASETSGMLPHTSEGTLTDAQHSLLRCFKSGDGQ